MVDSAGHKPATSLVASLVLRGKRLGEAKGWKRHGVEEANTYAEWPRCQGKRETEAAEHG